MAERSKIEEIKSKLDIVSTIREYVPNMKRSGKNYFILCPFHHEKTPSCAVNEDIQRFKCFGCGESGDVISFIEKIEGIEFPKALEIAAKKAGVSLPKNFRHPGESKEYKTKQKIYEVNQITAEFFHYVLTKHDKGKEGLDYAKKRGLTNELLKKFMIGYAPEGYENLKNFLTKKGYETKDLVDWSLLVSKNNKVYDKFRKRLIFPIFNHIGDITGFSGRVIDKEDIPKYLNSSATLVYKKSEILYGLFQAKDHIRKKKFSVIAEGNVDVPIAHKIGLENTVAPMGTALTEKQLRLLKRYTETVYFAFDSDSAGEAALIRSHKEAEKIGLSSKVIYLGEYTDLDDLISSDPDLAHKKINKAEPIIENLIKRFSKRLNLGEAKGKSTFVKLILPPLSQVEDRIEQAHYVQQISSLVSVDEKLIWDKLGKTSTSKKKNESENIKREKDEPSLKEQYIIAMLLQNPFLRKLEFNMDYIQDEKLTSMYLQLKDEKNIKKKVNKLNSQGQKLATELLMMDIGSFESEHELKNNFLKESKYLEKQFLKKQLGEIKRKMKQLESENKDVSKLLKEQNQIIKQLKNQKNT
ncbi:DNA primase [Candidatus Dojkabacteria bacterium]|nr:DNA primase [Candidatus Dojkabacteria bacterium]